jgi:hypothetical protein
MAPGRVTLWPLMKWLIVRMESFSSPLVIPEVTSCLGNH